MPAWEIANQSAKKKRSVPQRFNMRNQVVQQRFPMQNRASALDTDYFKINFGGDQ